MIDKKHYVTYLLFKCLELRAWKRPELGRWTATACSVPGPTQTSGTATCPRSEPTCPGTWATGVSLSQLILETANTILSTRRSYNLGTHFIVMGRFIYGVSPCEFIETDVGCLLNIAFILNSSNKTYFNLRIRKN